MEKLSKRLQAVADLVERGRIVCDAGCDHGFVSIYLVEAGICPRVFAMDVRPGPLSHAKEHIAEAGLDTQIITRLSDGVTALAPGEANCLILAGMGGRLMQKILTEGREKIHRMEELILQPQSEVMEFRRFIRSEGYQIIQEDMVLEDGKYYPMMKVKVVLPAQDPEEACDALQPEKAECTGEMQSDLELYQVYDRYGQYLLKARNPVLKSYLELEKKQAESIYQNIIKNVGETMSEKNKERLSMLENEAKWREKALSFYA